MVIRLIAVSIQRPIDYVDQDNTQFTELKLKKKKIIFIIERYVNSVDRDTLLSNCDPFEMFRF